MLYEVKFKNFLIAIICKKLLNKKINFLKTKQQIKLNTIDAIKFAQAKIIIHFDKSHKPSNLKNKMISK